MGSRTGENQPDVLKWEVVVTALDLGLQAYRTTASRDRFIDALAEVGRARELEARCVRAEEALRLASRIIAGEELTDADSLALMEALAAVPEKDTA